MKQDLQVLLECTPFLGEAHDSFPLSVIIIYNDMHAALRAADSLERLGHQFRGKLRQCLRPVRLDYLDDPACFEHALSDASGADIVIVSYNGPGDFPATLKKWVNGYAAQKRTGDSAIVALLSSQEELDQPHSPRYQFLKNATKAAGVDFFAPTPADDSFMGGRLELAG